jgi:hypothetical protein
MDKHTIMRRMIQSKSHACVRVQLVQLRAHGHIASACLGKWKKESGGAGSGGGGAALVHVTGRCPQPGGQSIRAACGRGLGIV